MQYLDKNYLRFRNRMFNFQQVEKICEEVIAEMKEENTANNQLIMALLTANVLNASPFKFGKKRLTEFFKLYFEQLECISKNIVDYDMVCDTVEKIGLKFEMRKNKLSLKIE